ncbi:glycosyltransferase family 2 protein [Halopenitus persicus]|uniref:glycosyltransferase family 2 protein n=1 Tax=Halopenitus persicus TaxID=1048396 RepID=UPI0012FE017C|nr:glycosyltransferase [Halopenitus persicus]
MTETFGKSDISLVIPTYNRDSHLEEFLNSIKPYTTEVEVLVIDDGSTDNTREVVSNSFAEYIQGGGNGQMEAKRIGVDKSSGKVVGFLEDDMRVDDDFINPIVTSLNNGEYIIQSKVIETSKNKSSISDGSEPNIAIKYFWNYDFINNLEQVSKSRYIPFVRESGLFVLKDILENIPLYDNNLLGDGWGESLSFSFRARDEGHRIYFHPQSVIYHLSATDGGSSGRFSKQKGDINGSGCTKFEYYRHRNSMYIHTRFFFHLALPTLIYRILYSIGKSIYYRDIRCVVYPCTGIVAGILKGTAVKALRN